MSTVSFDSDGVRCAGVHLCGEGEAFADAEGLALDNFLNELATDDGAAGLLVAPADYGELVEAAMADRVVRRPGAPGARVRILGPLEARLVAAPWEYARFGCRAYALGEANLPCGVNPTYQELAAAAPGRR